MDYTQYSLNGRYVAGKGRSVLAVIKDYVEKNPTISYDQLKKEFPDSLQGSETFTTKEKALGKVKEATKRNFTKPDEFIELSDATIVVSTQWGASKKDGRTNFERFLFRCKELNIDIQPIKQQ
jgi:hypothetical protein